MHDYYTAAKMEVHELSEFIVASQVLYGVMLKCDMWNVTGAALLGGV